MKRWIAALALSATLGACGQTTSTEETPAAYDEPAATTEAPADAAPDPAMAAPPAESTTPSYSPPED